ncbi:unnamed protein product [Musa acuminata subsp. malaccensis]|uniref:(wild Malaysian banana) hypothetical protein n=1 Tax=Musa acuminata subsp. malaccensis TaxID=214687 RepID=A0A804LBL3_MUSAM|nr:unnamed protein product [Musa acuminata subsp. malaccensis]
MHMWYARQLELPDGMLLKGVTLLAIKPSEERTTGQSMDLSRTYMVARFQMPLKSHKRTAAKMLKNYRTYSLEMNSF